MKESLVKLSIVSTLYKSEPFLAEFIERCINVASGFAPFELILVDDGSPDNSLHVARDFAKVDSRIVVIELSRNFGHHRAILAGLRYASGENVFFVDSDLEEAPELLIQFNRLMLTGDYDVVFGMHTSSSGSIMRRFTSKLFWKTFRMFAESDAPVNICNVRLMTAQYVRELCSLPETNIFLGGLFHWIGFRQIAVHVERRITRQQSTYSLWGRISLAVKSIVSFSSAPLKAMFYAGSSIALTSLLIAFAYFIWRLNQNEPETGFASLIISIWFLSGLIIGCLGIVGIYISYMYMEVKARPQTIVRSIYKAER